VGGKVRVKWIFEERKRIVELTVLEEAPRREEHRDGDREEQRERPR